MNKWELLAVLKQNNISAIVEKDKEDPIINIYCLKEDFEKIIEIRNNFIPAWVCVEAINEQN